MTPRRRKQTYFRFNGFEQLESKFMLSCSPLAADSSSQERSGDAIAAAFVGWPNAGGSSASTASFSSSTSQGTALSASLTDPDGTDAGTATYQTGSVKWLATVTTFTVSVVGAAASSTLNVSIGSTVVGTITTNSSGDGTLALSSDPTGTQQSLPSGFPTTVAAGTAVTVGTSLTGTLAATSTTPPGGCDGSHSGTTAGTTTTPNLSMSTAAVDTALCGDSSSSDASGSDAATSGSAWDSFVAALA